MHPIYRQLACQRRDRYKRVILESGASFYMPLTETSGTMVTDLANGGVGTVNGGTLSYTGCPIVGSNSPCPYFSGAAGQYITMPSSSFVHPTGSFTLLIHAYMLDTNPHEFMCKGTVEFAGAPSGTDWELGYVGGFTYLQFYTGSGSATYNTASLGINRWVQYIARFTAGSEYAIFQNGVKSSTSTANASVGTSTGQLKISGITYRHNGFLAHAAYFPKALSDGQCQDLYRISEGAM